MGIGSDVAKLQIPVLSNKITEPRGKKEEQQQVQFEASFSNFFLIYIPLDRYVSHNKVREVVIGVITQLSTAQENSIRIRKCNSFAEAARFQRSLAAGCFHIVCLKFFKIIKT